VMDAEEREAIEEIDNLWHMSELPLCLLRENHDRRQIKWAERDHHEKIHLQLRKALRERERVRRLSIRGEETVASYLVEETGARVCKVMCSEWMIRRHKLRTFRVVEKEQWSRFEREMEEYGAFLAVRNKLRGYVPISSEPIPRPVRPVSLSPREGSPKGWFVEEEEDPLISASRGMRVLPAQDILLTDTDLSSLDESLQTTAIRLQRNQSPRHSEAGSFRGSPRASRCASPALHFGSNVGSLNTTQGRSPTATRSQSIAVHSPSVASRNAPSGQGLRAIQTHHNLSGRQSMSSHSASRHSAHAQPRSPRARSVFS